MLSLLVSLFFFSVFFFNFDILWSIFCFFIFILLYFYALRFLFCFFSLFLDFLFYFILFHFRIFSTGRLLNKINENQRSRERLWEGIGTWTKQYRQIPDTWKCKKSTRWYVHLSCMEIIQKTYFIVSRRSEIYSFTFIFYFFCLYFILFYFLTSLYFIIIFLQLLLIFLFSFFESFFQNINLLFVWV